MAKRVEALDCRKWADGFLTRLGRYSRRDRRRKPPPDVEGEVKERLVRRFVARAGAHDPARLRRDAARARAASRPRDPDARDPRAPSRARRAAGDRRPHRQRPPPPESRAVVRAAPDPPLRRARLPRARAGRGVAHAPRARPHLDAPDRAAPAQGRRRRSRARTSSGSRAASRGTTARRSPSTAPGARTSS